MDKGQLLKNSQGVSLLLPWIRHKTTAQRDHRVHGAEDNKTGRSSTLSCLPTHGKRGTRHPYSIAKCFCDVSGASKACAFIPTTSSTVNETDKHTHWRFGLKLHALAYQQQHFYTAVRNSLQGPYTRAISPIYGNSACTDFLFEVLVPVSLRCQA